MRWPGRLALFAVLVAGGGLFVWHEAAPPQTGPGAGTDGGRPSRRGGGAGGRRGGQEGPVSVLTEPSRVEDVPVTLEAVGTAQALNSVTVRSQVDGRLVELAFREGQDVKQGDVIARVDPTIYQAQYDQAVAKKAQDEANVANARIDLARYVSLAATNAGSKQQADTQRATVAQLEAQIKSDQGAIDNARAYLDYTTIRAPLAGRLGIRLVDQGNLVRAADSTGIAVITQLQPITVLFNLPQQNLKAVNRPASAGPVPVAAFEADNRTPVDQGEVTVVDNQVDQSTGTVKVKATFPNSSLQLWPGAFVNVRVTTDIVRNAVVVPTAAVQRGPTGAFVYGVADDKAVLKPVTLGRQTETITVVASGVTPPERVVTTGFARLTDGEPVTVADPPAASADAQPPPPRRERRRSGEGGPPGPRGEAIPGEQRRGREGRRREGRAGEAGEPPAAAPSAAGSAPETRPAEAPSPTSPAGTGSTRP